MFEPSITLTTGAAATAYIETTSAHVLAAVSTRWCIPCRLMKPVLRKLAHEFALPILLLDGDEEKAFIRRYGVDSFPTLLFFNGGRHRLSERGYRGYRELRSTFLTALRHPSEPQPIAAELLFENGIARAAQAFEEAMALASIALEPHVAAVDPILTAHADKLRHEVEAGRLSASEAQALHGAERRRLYAPFQDKIEVLQAAQDAAILVYEATADALADTFAAVPSDRADTKLRRRSMTCVDGACRPS